MYEYAIKEDHKKFAKKVHKLIYHGWHGNARCNKAIIMWVNPCIRCKFVMCGVVPKLDVVALLNLKVHRVHLRCRSSLQYVYHVDKKKETTMKAWPIQYAYLKMAQREWVHLYEDVENVGVAHHVRLHVTKLFRDGNALRILRNERTWQTLRKTNEVIESAKPIFMW